MPNPYFDVSVISRSGGRSAVATAAYDSGSKLSSAVASAAYRSGEMLHDEHARKTFDYRRKENIVHVEIMTPDDVPRWAADRQRLWNEVEASEKRKDAQLARSVIAALPRELSHDENIALVRDYVREQFVARGMIADIAIHDKDASDGGRNPHVHIMLTLRSVSAEGFGKKNRDWNAQHLVGHWRSTWEAANNRCLEAAGCAERVSLQSYEAQGIDRVPQQHLGYEAAALEKHGVETRIGDRNRDVRQGNALREAQPEPAPLATPFGSYSRDDIERYYEKQWAEETRLYEPDEAALDAMREKERAQKAASAGKWERYVAMQRRTSTWYGSSETKTVYAWRRVTDRLGQQEAERAHLQVVRQSLGSYFVSSIRETAERAGRLAGRVRDAVREYGQGVLDRYTRIARETARWEKRQEQGYER